MKKFIQAITMIFVLVLMLNVVSPVVSYANGADEVNVTIQNGKLNITGGAFNQQDSTSVWNTIIGKYKGFIVGVSGIGAVTALGFFIVNFMKLGTSSGNPQARSQALTGLLWSGIATAGLGSVALIVGLFYNMFKG